MQTNRPPSNIANKVASVTLLLLAIVSSTGCQNWPQSKRAMQSQIESERLLSEFRAQKKRAEELESRNKLLSERLSESEKMLASLQSTAGQPNRMASRSPVGLAEPTLQNPTMQRYASEFQQGMADRSGASSFGNRQSTTNASLGAFGQSGEVDLSQPMWRPIDR